MCYRIRRSSYSLTNDLWCEFVRLMPDPPITIAAAAYRRDSAGVPYVTGAVVQGLHGAGHAGAGHAGAGQAATGAG